MSGAIKHLLTSKARRLAAAICTPGKNMQSKKSSRRNDGVKYELSPLEIVNRILEKPKDIDNVRSFTTKDVTYVSLNYSNPDLKKIMPWCGTSHGPESIVKTFVAVGRFWKTKSFEKEVMLTDGENVAIFGRFTYESRVLSRTVTSPFSMLAKVHDGRCTYMQFMEDTFATGASFRSGGKWIFHSDAQRKEVSI